jgi:hypothetical protein
MAGVDTFPYTPVPASLKRILEKIPSIGIPQKADMNWLGALGFSGGNNRMNLALLRQVGIIDGSGRPTDLYRALRSKDKARFATGLKEQYADLFSMYPDANRQDDEALMTYARSKTDYAEGTQRLAVRTFKVFTEFGDFAAADTDAGDDRGEIARDGDGSDRGDGGGDGRSRRRTTTSAGGVGLTVNIQLQLPPSADGEVYEKLFAAMAKHLKGLVTIE